VGEPLYSDPGCSGDEFEISAREDAAPAAYVDTERHPRPKSFYKAKKAQEKKKSQG